MVFLMVAEIVAIFNNNKQMIKNLVLLNLLFFLVNLSIADTLTYEQYCSSQYSYGGISELKKIVEPAKHSKIDEILKGSSYKVIYQQLQGICSINSFCASQIPWLFSFNTNPIIQKVGLLYSLNLIIAQQSTYSTKTMTEILDTDQIDKLILLNDSYSILNSEDTLEIEKLITVIKTKESIKNQKYAVQLLPSLCFFNNLGEKCGVAIKRVFKIMSPAYVSGLDFQPLKFGFGENVGFSIPEEYKEFLENSIYFHILKLANKTLIEKIKSAESGIKPTEGNIDADLIGAIKTIAKDENKIQQYFWTIMAIYGSRAGSFASTFPYFTANLNKSIFQIMAFYSLSSYFNSLYFKSYNKNYTLPTETNSHCFQGQVYHFWMAGYLSRKLTIEGFDKTSAVNAVHLVGLLYELLPHSYLRQHSKFNFNKIMQIRHKTLIKNFGSYYSTQFKLPYNNNFLMDLTWNEAWMDDKPEMKAKYSSSLELEPNIFDLLKDINPNQILKLYNSKQ